MPAPMAWMSFLSLIVMEGSGKVQGPENQVEFQAGDSLFIPAGSGQLYSIPPAGKGKISGKGRYR